MNNMSLDQFVEILRNDPITASKLTYLSNDLIVHHIDEDCTNDALSNLTTIAKLDHDAHHAERYSNSGDSCPALSTHVSAATTVDRV